MSNLIQDAKEQISSILNRAREKAVGKGELPAGAVLSGSDDAGYDYVIALPEGRSGLRALAQQLRTLGGGGGGSEELISGRINASRDEILASGFLPYKDS